MNKQQIPSDKQPSKDDLAAALRQLSESDHARSETARLRAIFDEVESGLQSGLKRKAMLDVLHARGFTMTMASFKSALQRIRQERKGQE